MLKAALCSGLFVLLKMDSTCIFFQLVFLVGAEQDRHTVPQVKSEFLMLLSYLILDRFVYAFHIPLYFSQFLAF